MYPEQDIPDTPEIHADAGCLMATVGHFRTYISNENGDTKAAAVDSVVTG